MGSGSGSGRAGAGGASPGDGGCAARLATRRCRAARAAGSSAGSNPKTAPRKPSSASIAARRAASPRKPWPSPSNAQVGVRDAVGGERRDDAPRPGLGGTTLSSRPCRTRTGQRHLVEVVDRRALAIAVGHRRIRPDQAVRVARLELVGVAGEGLEVADAELADARRERVAEGERGEGRVAAGAAALDGQPVGSTSPRSARNRAAATQSSTSTTPQPPSSCWR